MPPVTLHFVDESAAIDLVSMVDAMEAVAQVFSAKYLGQAKVFPVVMAHGTDPGTRFGVKSGLVMDPPLVGLKVGTYWPGNPRRGLQAHGSTTLLLDDLSGFPRAIVAASHLTALRTAAADGVATRELSRVDAETVALIGAGHQAWYELDAVRQVRRIRRVLIWSRNAQAATDLAQRVCERMSLDAEAVDLERAVRGADIIVTATSANVALFPAEWVRPGTHISAMGADARGKQELDPSLVATARLFADDVSQSLTIGEFEAAHAAGWVGPEQVTEIGALLAGAVRGRLTESDITIFDSSGIALQDLAVAQLALQKAKAAGRAQCLS